MHRFITHPGTLKLAGAAAALPVLLLVAGCSSDSGSEEGRSTPSAAPSKSAAPVKHTKLPEACGTLSKKTVKDVVPGTQDTTGKELTSSDTERYGSCLWSGGAGKNDAEYRSLTVSLKRYESDGSLGTGEKQAERFYTQEGRAAVDDETNKGVEQAPVTGAGQTAVAVSYRTEKKKQEYQVTRVVVRDANVVITVDYEGTGFEGTKTPGAEEVRRNAEKAARESVKALG